MPKITNGNPTSISLSLKNDNYTVLIGSDLLKKTSALIETHTSIRTRAVAVVTDSTVGPLYADSVLNALRSAGHEPVLITVPVGEASKSMEKVTEICREMLRAGLDRKSFLIALGGGVIGDLAGFAAAIFQRGIPCVQIPTTIVSQVDSSVGGKTGVNTPEGKNLIGAFHQPQLVIADVDTLGTLPDREFNEGFAEIIKHAGIRDESLLTLVEQRETIKGNLIELVSRNVIIKAAVVEEDERETSGTRALLNFGHTIGHGIESAGGYGRFLHGEAISLGLVAAIRLSVAKSTLREPEGERLIRSLKTYELPTELANDLEEEAILKAMQRDKKFEAGQIRFVLLDKLGNGFVSKDVTTADIKSAIRDLRGSSA
ncbi:3-dehydroquinate synthase [Verrucomicrobiales bacterium]|jgi:3-dehydroquinate synthase|nr:3-dehydroquinate synthase [Verrucomicrobiales bacterium]